MRRSATAPAPTGRRMRNPAGGRLMGIRTLLSTPSVTPIIMRRKDWNSITMIIMNAQAIR